MKTEKLTLKHLAVYLPYGLKVFFKDFRKSGIIKHPNGSIFDLTIYNITYLDYDIDKKFTILKPILRPLSDLVKEIEINGEKFIPLGKLHYKYCLTASGQRTTKAAYDYHIDRNTYATYYGVNGGSFGIYINTLEIDRTHYRILRWLFEWHFDVFGLIDAGLAIDINKLEDETNG